MNRTQCQHSSCAELRRLETASLQRAVYSTKDANAIDKIGPTRWGRILDGPISAGGAENLAEVFLIVPESRGVSIPTGLRSLATDDTRKPLLREVGNAAKLLACQKASCYHCSDSPPRGEARLKGTDG